MTEQEVREVVRDVEAGDEMKLVFNSGTGEKLTLDEVTREAVRYLGATKGWMVDIANKDWCRLMTARLSGNWDTDERRMVNITVLKAFDPEQFSSRYCGGLESIEVVA